MDLERKMDLIRKPPTEEIITEEDLRELLQTKDHPVAYDGFETSGLLHMGSGVLRAIKIQDMLDADCDFILWVADWFAYINNKNDRYCPRGEFMINNFVIYNDQNP